MAQQLGTVHVQGVVEHAVPLLNRSMLLVLAMCLALLAVTRLRRSGLLLAVVGAGVLFALANPRLLTAASSLSIPAASPVCNGQSESFSFDPYAVPSLMNQCAAAQVRISGYELPCTTPGAGAAPGAVLGPGESLILQQCASDSGPDVPVDPNDSLAPDPNTPDGGAASGNQPPDFSLSTTAYTIAEDAGPQLIPGWLSSLRPGPASEAAQPVSTAVSNDHTALFASAPVLSGNDLLFTPADDAFGEALITLTATDSEGASSAQTLLLTITPVNDPPSFNVPRVLRVLEDNGLDTGADPDEPEYDEGPDGADSAPVSVANVATGISPGNTWEADQTVHFEVSHSEGQMAMTVVTEGEPSGTEAGEILDTVVFLPVPAPLAADFSFSPVGTFTTALTPHAWGEVELSVTAVDSDGLRSAPRHLRLEVAPVWDSPPEGRDLIDTGNENSPCIRMTLPGIIFRHYGRPQFILTDTDLNGGKILKNGVPVPFDRPISASSLCYRPPADGRSVYNAVESRFEPFATFNYRVWTGVGDWRTGESPALDGSEHSGVFLDLSESYRVEVVVTPKF